MRRRRKRKREKISKSQAAADTAEPTSKAAPSAAAAEAEDGEAVGQEEDENLTAADELAPMQVGTHCYHQGDCPQNLLCFLSGVLADQT